MGLLGDQVYALLRRDNTLPISSLMESVTDFIFLYGCDYAIEANQSRGINNGF